MNSGPSGSGGFSLVFGPQVKEVEEESVGDDTDVTSYEISSTLSTPRSEDVFSGKPMPKQGRELQLRSSNVGPTDEGLAFLRTSIGTGSLEISHGLETETSVGWAKEWETLRGEKDINDELMWGRDLIESGFNGDGHESPSSCYFSSSDDEEDTRPRQTDNPQFKDFTSRRRKQEKEQLGSLTSGQAASAAWVLFRLKRGERSVLRRALVRWALEATAPLPSVPSESTKKSTRASSFPSPQLESHDATQPQELTRGKTSQNRQLKKTREVEKNMRENVSPQLSTGVEGEQNTEDVPVTDLPSPAESEGAWEAAMDEALAEQQVSLTMEVAKQCVRLLEKSFLRGSFQRWQGVRKGKGWVIEPQQPVRSTPSAVDGDHPWGQTKMDERSDGRDALTVTDVEEENGSVSSPAVVEPEDGGTMAASLAAAERQLDDIGALIHRLHNLGGSERGERVGKEGAEETLKGSEKASRPKQTSSPASERGIARLAPKSAGGRQSITTALSTSHAPLTQPPSLNRPAVDKREGMHPQLAMTMLDDSSSDEDEKGVKTNPVSSNGGSGDLGQSKKLLMESGLNTKGSARSHVRSRHESRDGDGSTGNDDDDDEEVPWECREEFEGDSAVDPARDVSVQSPHQAANPLTSKPSNHARTTGTSTQPTPLPAALVRRVSFNLTNAPGEQGDGAKRGTDAPPAPSSHPNKAAIAGLKGRGAMSLRDRSGGRSSFRRRPNFNFGDQDETTVPGGLWQQQEEEEARLRARQQRADAERRAREVLEKRAAEARAVAEAAALDAAAAQAQAEGAEKARKEAARRVNTVRKRQQQQQQQRSVTCHVEESSGDSVVSLSSGRSSLSAAAAPRGQREAQQRVAQRAAAVRQAALEVVAAEHALEAHAAAAAASAAAAATPPSQDTASSSSSSSSVPATVAEAAAAATSNAAVAAAQRRVRETREKAQKLAEAEAAQAQELKEQEAAEAATRKAHDDAAAAAGRLAAAARVALQKAQAAAIDAAEAEARMHERGVGGSGGIGGDPEDLAAKQQQQQREEAVAAAARRVRDARKVQRQQQLELEQRQQFWSGEGLRALEEEHPERFLDTSSSAEDDDSGGDDEDHDGSSPEARAARKAVKAAKKAEKAARARQYRAAAARANEEFASSSSAAAAALRARSATRSRLLRKLATAERRREKDEADRARQLLRRAADQQKVYDQQFKQCDATRERLSHDNNKRGSTSGSGQSTFAAADKTTRRAAELSDRKTSRGTAAAATNATTGNTSGGPEKAEASLLQLGKGHRRLFPNFPLLDVCSGQWHSLWELFRGSLVVAEFYLTNLTEARSVPPVIAVDP